MWQRSVIFECSDMEPVIFSVPESGKRQQTFSLIEQQYDKITIFFSGTTGIIYVLFPVFL